MQNNNNNNINNNNNDNNFPYCISINLETFSLSDLNIIISKSSYFKDKTEPIPSFYSPYSLDILDSNENFIAHTVFTFPLNANLPEEEGEFYNDLVKIYAGILDVCLWRSNNTGDLRDPNLYYLVIQKC